MTRRIGAWVAASFLCFGPVASAAPARSAEAPDDKEMHAEAPSRPSEMPLSLLPEPPSLDLTPPRPAALEAIDGILGHLSSADPVARERALGELLETRPDWVSGLARRIDRLAERSDKTAMRALLEKLRERARRGPSDDDATSDYLALALASPAPDSAVWRDLVQVLAIGRMLKNIGSADAVRELIRIYVRFGEFMRISTQRELDALGDRQIAGLYEARRHQAPKIASWASKRLDLLGKSIPHEAVRTKDAAALADILVALGRSRDPDAGRVLISFAASERSQIRLAARQGVALLGEVGSWQLRDAYQDTTGKQAPRDWTWKRTARELFTEYDRIRSAKVFEIFEAAQKAEAAGKLAEMAQGYDRVLAASPLFEERELMAAGYMKYAESVQASSPDLAIGAFRRVERIAKEEALRNRAESARHTLEAAALDATGLVDRGLLDKALALDPDNGRARDALDASVFAQRGLANSVRYLLAGAVALLSLGGAGYVVWMTLGRRRLMAAATPEASPERDDEPLPEPDDEPAPESDDAPASEPEPSPDRDDEAAPESDDERR